MALSNSQYDAIMREYDGRQSRRRQEQRERQEEAYERAPGLRKLDGQMAGVAARQARRLLEGQESAVEDLKKEGERIGRERVRLLAQAGLAADYLELRYDCPLCRDKGFVDGQKCRCFRQKELELLYRQSQIRERLKTENFAACTEECYSDQQLVEGGRQTVRQYMHGVIAGCRRFAERFGKEGGNLVFYGSTGVGKTFLAGCIARELIEAYYSVVYLSAADLFDMLAKERFGRDEEAAWAGTARLAMECDLLIVDDLGTELSNSWTNSQLFYCLNERLLQKKSTIITTNLTPGQLGREYSERVGSRLIENFRFVSIPGADIRIWKQREQRKKHGGEK